MGFGAGQLRDKALLALEEALQECRYRTPRRSFAIRFALAYLWHYSGNQREPFDEFWRCLGEAKTPWSFSSADRALEMIYRSLGMPRDEKVSQEMWRRRQDEERAGR